MIKATIREGIGNKPVEATLFRVNGVWWGIAACEYDTQITPEPPNALVLHAATGMWWWMIKGTQTLRNSVKDIRRDMSFPQGSYFHKSIRYCKVLNPQFALLDRATYAMA